MKLLSYRTNEADRIGVLLPGEERALPLDDLGFHFTSMNHLIQQGDLGAIKAAFDELSPSYRGAVQLREVEKRPPIPHPLHDMICLGLIYLDHAAQAAKMRGERFTGKREYPVYFVKRTPEATPDGAGIPWRPGYAQDLGYGVELVVVLGREARNVSEEEAHQYIFGYTIANDVTCRELSRRHYHPFFGKSLDGYNPMGPWIVTADEFPPDHVFRLHARINGELRQSSSTDKLTFSIPYLISELSRCMTLPAGTLISTGSPGEGDLGFEDPAVLHPGDLIECEIEGIGKLHNSIVFVG